MKLINQWQTNVPPHLALYLCRQAFEAFKYALYLEHSTRPALYGAQVRGLGGSPIVEMSRVKISFFVSSAQRAVFADKAKVPTASPPVRALVISSLRPILLSVPTSSPLRSIKTLNNVWTHWISLL